MTLATTATAARLGAAPSLAVGQNIFLLLGRMLMASLFIPAGFAKLTGFGGTVGYIVSKGLPMPEVAAVIAIAVELGAGIALLVGYRTRIAAIVLAVFTLAAALLFHDYWAAPEAQRMVQMLFFTKNVAIVGGLLAFAGLGGGHLSIDGRHGKAI